MNIHRVYYYVAFTLEPDRGSMHYNNGYAKWEYFILSVKLRYIYRVLSHIVRPG